MNETVCVFIIIPQFVLLSSYQPLGLFGEVSKTSILLCGSSTSLPYVPLLILIQALETIHGDMDSLSPAAREWATTLGTNIEVNHDQESTDFEKCIDYITANYLPTHSSTCSPATSAYATPDILVLGGLGGRVDQSLSVLHHLYKGPRLYPAGRIYLLTTSAITFLLPAGRHRIVVREIGRAHV